MRKNYIDNLRWLCVLMLFPYHVLMIYNSFGENFYIKGIDIKATTTFIFVTWPWFMPFLFVIAGISTTYAMQKKSICGYLKERTFKLLIPLAAGILLVIPVQTYFAELFHNEYTGGYFAQYILFFTKQTDLTGYTGGFTPGQLWFILYLFVISLVAIPLIILNRKFKFNFSRLPIPIILVLFIFPLLGTLILDISGKSLGEYLAYFLLGYFILSDESIQTKLEKRRFWLFVIGLGGMVVLILWWYGILSLSDLFYDIFSRFYAWVMILSLMGLGKKYLEIKNKFTTYMSHSSFSVYIFHQTWIVVSAYNVFKITGNVPVQMVLIFLLSIFLTFSTYEICRRLRVARFLFSIKK